MHMKNVQIEGHTHILRQFKGNVVLDPKLETNMGNK
jgi:hypothetical protein